VKNEDKINAGERINNFIQKNREGLFIIAGVVVLLFIGFVTYISLQDVFRKKAISEVEDLEKRFENVRFLLSDENNSGNIDVLLSDTQVFALKNSGYAGSKAWTIIAQIYYSRKEWKLSEDAWINASRTGAKTYLGPISLFNAAAAAEEQGKLELAIEYLEKSVSHQFEFPAAAHAQFSIGRLYEKLNNFPAAIDAYRTVLINWPDVPVWQHLARSRIIMIEVN
jgi:tetratricopeptide (TPR) repeat protein